MILEREIYASDSFFTLLQNNKPKKIGEVKKGKYYISTGIADVECILVTFDFDQNNKEDLFFFNRDRLIFYVLCEYSHKNRNWLYESLITNSKSISMSELIDQVVEIYTTRELGF